MTSIFLPSSASTQISYAVKFNMADKVHRLSLAASQHFGYIVMLRARMFRSLIPVLMIKERNIRERNITI